METDHTGNTCFIIVCFIAIGLLLPSAPVTAATITYVKEYSYQAGEMDSKLSCRTIALEQVKRLLLEEIGTYLMSETTVKDFQITKDQIVTLTAGVVRTTILEETWDGRWYTLKAEIEADPDDVAKQIDILRNDKEKTKELEEAWKAADEALLEVERLKKEYEKEQSFAGGKQEEYIRNVNTLGAAGWFQSGYNAGITGNHQTAIASYNNVIVLQPRNANAYYNRAAEYGKLGNHKEAIRNYTKVIKLEPRSGRAYHNRGIEYGKIGNTNKARENFRTAVKLRHNPSHRTSSFSSSPPSSRSGSRSGTGSGSRSGTGSRR